MKSSPDETTYLVDYQLADGTVVRAKDDRPVMSAAEWESTRAEARRLYQAGQYERKVITPDDEPVRVIEITLSTGETVVILDHPKVTQDIWGLD